MADVDRLRRRLTALVRATAPPSNRESRYTVAVVPTLRGRRDPNPAGASGVELAQPPGLEVTFWSATGRRWRRPPRTCPDWCGGGHLCTAQHGYSGGGHRSESITVRTGYGVMVCTRVQSIGGRGRLELRL